MTRRLTDETDETYDPDQTVTLSMQRTEQTHRRAAGGGGVPGAASNAPNTAGACPSIPQQTTPPQSGEDRVGNLRGFEDGAARGGKSRAGAADDGGHRGERPAGCRPRHKGASARCGSRASADELRNLTALAQAAVGFDTTRGDMVTA